MDNLVIQAYEKADTKNLYAITRILELLLKRRYTTVDPRFLDYDPSGGVHPAKQRPDLFHRWVVARSGPRNYIKLPDRKLM